MYCRSFDLVFSISVSLCNFFAALITFLYELLNFKRAICLSKDVFKLKLRILIFPNSTHQLLQPLIIPIKVRQNKQRAEIM
jgi:hypothetical protein